MDVNGPVVVQAENGWLKLAVYFKAPPELARNHPAILRAVADELERQLAPATGRTGEGLER